MAYELYSTQVLLGVYREMEPIQDFWLQFFPGVFESTAQNIEFNKVRGFRNIAPFVLPTVQGRPSMKQAEEVLSFAPAYVKPKDAVDAAAMMTRRAGLGELGQAQQLSPEQRHDAIVAAIMRKHREDIERSWEYLAAQAIQNGSVTISGEAYPETTIDFRRDPSLTVTLSAGNRWGDTGVDIIDFLNDLMETMVDLPFGAMPTELILGKSVLSPFLNDAKIQRLLDRDLRNTSNTELNLGVGNGERFRRIGSLNTGLNVWLYHDYYEDANGAQVEYMDRRDAVLVSSAVQGVKCYGAILDKRANLRPLPMFPKMWDEEDPAQTTIMTQSAPLMLPVHPNATARARVVG